MKFFVGVAVGAIGMWAYQSGKFDSLMGVAPDSMQQAWQPAAERFGQMANSDQVRQVGSTLQSGMQQVQDRVQQVQGQTQDRKQEMQSGGGSAIVTPSAAEISGRPSEPLPTPGA